jgi:hypothetical protein
MLTLISAQKYLQFTSIAQDPSLNQIVEETL